MRRLLWISIAIACSRAASAEPRVGVHLSHQPRPAVAAAGEDAATDAGAATGTFAIQRTTASDRPVWRDSGCVRFVYDSAGTAQLPGDRELDILDQAFAAWAATDGCAPLAISTAEQRGVGIGRDGVSAVVFRDSSWPYDPGAAAVTRLFFVDDPSHPDDGKILEADIELNAVDFAFLDEGETLAETGEPVDLLSVATHEVGHALGLAHNCDDGGGERLRDADDHPVPDCRDVEPGSPTALATMFPSMDRGEVHKRSPEKSDRQALCSVATRGQCGDELAGVGCSAGGGRAGGLGLVVLALLLACRRRGRAAVLAAALAAGGCDVETGALESPLIGGEARQTTDAAVAIAAGDTAICSGVLISPRVVLTAAHCVPDQVPGVDVGDVEVVFGADLDGERIAVASSRFHPLWADLTTRNDVGLLALADAAPVASLPLASAVHVARLVPGVPLRAVGFGRDDSGELGRKRQGEVVVAAVNESTIELDRAAAITCDGDSGGPLIDASSGVEVVVGLHARSNCNDLAVDERVDVHIDDFINPFVTEVEAGLVCAGDGVCDADCAADSDCEPGAAIGGCSSAPGGAPAPLLLLLVALIGRRRSKLNRAGAPGRAKSSDGDRQAARGAGRPLAKTRGAETRREVRRTTTTATEN